MTAVMIIALANAAVDLGIKLYAASQTMPDKNDPEAQAAIGALKKRLQDTDAEVQAYTPKQV